MTNTVWLRTDNSTEVIKGVEFVNDHLDKVAETYNWKWIITGWHSVLQNIMILALDQGDFLQVFLASNNRRELRIFQEAQQDNYENINNLRLPNFLDLYSAIKSDRFFDVAFPDNEFCNDAMTKINDLRNSFIHFHPEGWSLQVNNLPDVILSTATMIDFFISTHQSSRFFIEEEEERSFLDGYNQLKTQILTIRGSYQSSL